MAGTVVTISSRVGAAEFERLARARVRRDGVAALAARTSNARQRGRLEQVAYRLAVDDGLDCYGLTPRPDGTTWLTVYARANRERRRSLAVWGEAKIR
jgi:streptogramin lyase